MDPSEAQLGAAVGKRRVRFEELEAAFGVGERFADGAATQVGARGVGEEADCLLVIPAAFEVHRQLGRDHVLTGSKGCGEPGADPTMDVDAARR